MGEEAEDERCFPSIIMLIGDGSLNLNWDLSYAKIHTLDAKRGSLGARCRLPAEGLGLCFIPQVLEKSECNMEEQIWLCTGRFFYFNLCILLLLLQVKNIAYSLKYTG